MNKTVKFCIVVLILTIVLFIYYLFNIKPYINGSFIPTEKDCKQSYECTCIQESCICKFKKYSFENKITCNKNSLSKEQIK